MLIYVIQRLIKACLPILKMALNLQGAKNIQKVSKDIYEYLT